MKGVSAWALLSSRARPRIANGPFCRWSTIAATRRVGASGKLWAITSGEPVEPASNVTTKSPVGRRGHVR
jgi:hypothetical protein